jgi:hypothetical protein
MFFTIAVHRPSHIILHSHHGRLFLEFFIIKREVRLSGLTAAQVLPGIRDGVTLLGKALVRIWGFGHRSHDV